jgi:hypothetical protein
MDYDDKTTEEERVWTVDESLIAKEIAKKTQYSNYTKTLANHTAATTLQLLTLREKLHDTSMLSSVISVPACAMFVS